MNQLEITDPERRDIETLLDEMEERYADLGSDAFLDSAPVFAHDLPARIRLVVNSFRLGKLSGTLRISGHEVDDERIGLTPGHWRDRSPDLPLLREELLLVLYGSLLGDPFGWVTQQDGHMVHDVLPIRGHEREQLGSSSAELLTWHTEDAFHPLRSDYLLFSCLRNADAALTTIGSVDDLDLVDSVKDVLFEERFFILPDESHRPHNNTEGEVDFTAIEEMRSRPDPIAVLFGDPNQPYIRADPYFMRVSDGDDEAQNALDHLVKMMDDQMTDVDLAGGDYFFIDNLRVVHGRKPFKAHYDGTDRWLKRLNITLDLRKSRASRASALSRAISS